MKRLLYVAMTRAEHWLIVAGAGDDDEAKLDGTWYQLVRGGLRRAEADADADGGLILEDEGAGAPEPDKTGRPAAPHDPPNLSGPPPGVVKTLRRAASELIQAPPAPTGGGLAPDIAARVGDAIHALLEADDAPDAAQLAARHDVSESNAAHAIAEAAAARALPDAAAFFAPGAIAEAGVSAEIGGIRVAGRIDRLIVEETRIAFVDFKSTRAPPAKPDGTPDAFLAQLAAYRDALREIYPEKSVEAHILWTAIPRLDQLDDGRMDAALARALSGAGAP